MFDQPVPTQKNSHNSCCATATGWFVLFMCCAVGPGVVALLAYLNPDERMTTSQDGVEQYYAGLGATLAAVVFHTMALKAAERISKHKNKCVRSLATLNGLLALLTFGSVITAGNAFGSEAPLGIGEAMRGTDYLEQRPYLASYLVALLYSTAPTTALMIIPSFVMKVCCCCKPRQPRLLLDESEPFNDASFPTYTN